MSSKIFAGYRALGFTSNHIPLVVRYRRKEKENYVITCVGNSFHTYNCSKLAIISVSDVHPEAITALAVDGKHVFTAAGSVIRAFAGGRKVAHTYEGHQKTVHLLLPFGNHLVSVDESSILRVWDVVSEELHLELPFDPTSFNITTILHPSTYLNKILLGSQQGALQLWNLRTNQLVFTFTGWQSAVTALEQAPAVDVVAVGLASGLIVLHNLKFDESVMTFTQDWGPVISMAFRTDGHPSLVTGSTLGHMAVWNLEEKKLQSQMREAHRGPVSGMACLASEPLLVTSSPDNSLKVWIFDEPDGGARQLRLRSGHNAPPHKVRFHGNTGQNILSAGQDSTLQSFSTVHDNQNKSLGRASYNKVESKKAGLKKDKHKMPPITAFASEVSRESDWDGIVACHHGEKLATTWSYRRSTMGAHKLLHDRFNSLEHLHTTAQCVDITSCGNFVVIGYSSGHVDTYNIQSGQYRGSYGNKKGAHVGCVRGVAVDGLNQLTITAGADQLLKFWKFKAKTLVDQLKLASQLALIVLHRESAMLAVALDDLTVCVVDVDTRRVVRSFSGHSGSITDMTFSSDARWLITTAMDATVCTWDLPTGALVDSFCVERAVTSLSMSPTGTFLVTTHVDDLGLYLWSNMTLYTHVSLKPLPADYQPAVTNLPNTAMRAESEAVLKEETNDETEEEEEPEFKSHNQISDELVTLSLLPTSRWLNLLNLDVIKRRNKPKEPPKLPKSAPFFLPILSGLEPKFDTTQDQEESDVSRVKTSRLQPLSQFAKLVQTTEESHDYSAVMARLKDLGPSAVDTELRCLAPEGGGSVPLMSLFLKCLQQALASHQDYELVQSYLALFLNLHGDVIAEEPVLRQAAEDLSGTQLTAWQDLNTLFVQNLCIVNYLRSAVI